jgi:hypothetical protein
MPSAETPLGNAMAIHRTAALRQAGVLKIDFRRRARRLERLCVDELMAVTYKHRRAALVGRDRHMLGSARLPGQPPACEGRFVLESQIHMVSGKHKHIFLCTRGG